MRQEFEVFALSTEGKLKSDELQEAFSATLDAVDELVPQGRELSLARTALQEACAWAIRGMSMQPLNRAVTR